MKLKFRKEIKFKLFGHKENELQKKGMWCLIILGKIQTIFLFYVYITIFLFNIYTSSVDNHLTCELKYNHMSIKIMTEKYVYVYMKEKKRTASLISRPIYYSCQY